jgi:hypothetical protein
LGRVGLTATGGATSGSEAILKVGVDDLTDFDAVLAALPDRVVLDKRLASTESAFAALVLADFAFVVVTIVEVSFGETCRRGFEPFEADVIETKDADDGEDADDGVEVDTPFEVDDSIAGVRTCVPTVALAWASTCGLADERPVIVFQSFNSDIGTISLRKRLSIKSG